MIGKWFLACHKFKSPISSGQNEARSVSCEICDKLWDFKSYNAKKPIWDVHILQPMDAWMPPDQSWIILPNRKVQAR